MPKDTLQSEWLHRVLGIRMPSPTGDFSPARTPPIATVVPVAARPKKKVAGFGAVLQENRARIEMPAVVDAEFFVDDKRQTITVSHSADGRAVYTSPPAPVLEVSFPGGGAKGAALPGAVKALHESGVLAGVKKVAGTSVGAMTAALVAAGISSEELIAVTNDENTVASLTEGTGGSIPAMLAAAVRNRFGESRTLNPLTGAGLEKMVGQVMNESLRKRIEEYVEVCRTNGAEADADVLEVAKALAQGGPTFMHLRRLSRVIPAIKELMVTATYTEELDTVDAASQNGFRNNSKRAQLYVFSADTEPDMQVSVAAQASAAIPMAFKPVDIQLSSGLKVRFVDGALLNNLPTSANVGNERALDPVPLGRTVALMFEAGGAKSKELLQGRAAPKQSLASRLQDRLLNADGAASAYAKNRVLADYPEDLVEVPMTLAPSPMAWHQRQALKPWKRKRNPDDDMRKGTLNFGLATAAKLKYQALAEQSMSAQLERAKKPQIREYASDSQMFVSIPLDELAALAAGAYAGAERVAHFRRRTGECVAGLQAAVKAQARSGGQISKVLETPEARQVLAELEALAGDDLDLQGYLARELNKSADLDELFKAARQQGRTSPALDATYAVADAVRARDYAQNILKQVVYVQLARERKGSAGSGVLLVMEDLLREALDRDDVNGALQMGIDHYGAPRGGNAVFAAELRQRRMS